MIYYVKPTMTAGPLDGSSVPVLKSMNMSMKVNCVQCAHSVNGLKIEMCNNDTNRSVCRLQLIHWAPDAR